MGAFAQGVSPWSSVSCWSITCDFRHAKKTFGVCARKTELAYRLRLTSPARSLQVRQELQAACMARPLGAPAREPVNFGGAPPRLPPVRRRVLQFGSRIGEGVLRDFAGRSLSGLQTRPQPWGLTTRIRVRGPRASKPRVPQRRGKFHSVATHVSWFTWSPLRGSQQLRLAPDPADSRRTLHWNEGYWRTGKTNGLRALHRIF